MEAASDFLRRYAENTDAHRLEATLAMIDDDAVYLFSDGSAHLGKTAIAHALKRNFAAIVDETYRIREVHWLLETAEAAACIYVFEWSGIVGGKPASGTGRGTSLLRREGQSWRIVHEHLSRGGLS